MKKKKILLILLGLIVLVCGSFATYSLFTSNASSQIEDQKIAQFVFDTKKTNSIDLAISDLVPGDQQEYTFSVSNQDAQFISHVTLNYQIIFETFHLMPLDIVLLKQEGEDWKEVFTCNESFSRNEENTLVCTSPIQEMEYSKATLEQYKIRVLFPKEYNGVEYSDLVDYLTVHIKSWQKMS